MDNRLLKVLEIEVAKEKAKKKKKPSLQLRKEKRLSYYSGWSRGGKPIESDKKEKQTKLS